MITIAGRSASSRDHLDARVNEDHKTAEPERLVAPDAQVVDEHGGRGLRTIAMPDPEGNEFCLR